VTRGARAEAQPARAMIELFLEAYRLRLLRGLEEGLSRCGYGLIAGVDEVGRGSLAGPVVAAAVIVDTRCLVPGVDDSKCLTAPERERAAAAIRSTAVAAAVAEVSPEVIDRINILEASRQAMREARQDKTRATLAEQATGWVKPLVALAGGIINGGSEADIDTIMAG